jgi:hypothetical protein
MTTPAQMSWDHHIVADDDQAVPAAPVADPASAPAEETAWGPRIVAPADEDQPLPEPPISDPASTTASASPAVQAVGIHSESRASEAAPDSPESPPASEVPAGASASAE